LAFCFALGFYAAASVLWDRSENFTPYLIEPTLLSIAGSAVAFVRTEYGRPILGFHPSRTPLAAIDGAKVLRHNLYFFHVHSDFDAS
jgi:hypothetical protein